MKNTDNVTVIPAGEHSPLGPSSSKRWTHCAGSVDASLDANDDESQFAAEGTAAHYLSELARKNGLPCSHWLDHIFQVGKYKFVVDEEMADSAQAFVDWCAEQDGDPLTETRIDYSEFMPPEVIEKYGKTFGTLDDARLRVDVAYITDFKHGKGVQEYAEKNTQLMLQALGVWCAFNWIYEMKGFQLQICQPRLNHFDDWYISTEDLLEWAKGLPGYAKAVLEGTQFAAGDWCKFCRIRKKCAVRANMGVQLALTADEFQDLDQLEIHAMRAQNRLQFITNEQIAKILPALDIFKAWIKDVERRAVAALIAGEPLAGWKLVEGRSNRKWVSEDDAAKGKICAAARPLGCEPFKDPELKSVSVLEKEMGKKAFAERLGELVTKPPGRPKIAAATDKRPAISTTALEEFDNLDADEDDFKT